MSVTGLRVSEALGLTWEDVDWEQKRVHVQRALVFAGQEYQMMPPKTKAGTRWVSLPEPAHQALLSLPRPLDASTPIFRTTMGTPPDPSDLRIYLGKLCDLAGAPRINVHGLRHVAATLAIKATRDVHSVQRRLGHSHVSVTMGIYAYALAEEGEVAAAVDALLEGRAGSA